MLRICSRRFQVSIEIAALLALACMAAFGQSTSSQPLSTQSLSGQSAPGPSSGQSLGDIARENQQKKAAAASSATPAKVFTNANLPKNPDGLAEPPADQSQNSSPLSAEAAAIREAEERQAAQQRGAEQHAAERWKRRILAQRSAIANLEAQIDELRASIQFVDPNYAYPGANSSAIIAHNRIEARELQRLHQMEQRLGQHRQRLDEMQEAARHAGMHSAVYDP
jgi:hypothetical protein